MIDDRSSADHSTWNTDCYHNNPGSTCDAEISWAWFVLPPDIGVLSRRGESVTDNCDHKVKLPHVIHKMLIVC